MGIGVIIIQAVSLLICFYVFEMTKAVVSTLLGDPTPKQHKMLTLNIFKYLEPVGFLLGFFFGYGWGVPAPVAPRYYKDRRTGTFITYTAPIILSVVLAALLGNIGNLMLKSLSDMQDNGVYAMAFLLLYSFVNQTALNFLRLAVFNLIPVPPMCGSEILKCFLDPNMAFKYGQNTSIIQMIFLMLWFFGMVTPHLDKLVALIAKALFVFG